MRIRAYVRLQKCKTVDHRAFVDRRFERHGVAAGPVEYFAVEAVSWAGIRRVLKTFEVTGHSQVTVKTAEAFVVDIGDAVPRLWKLHPVNEVPEAARWSPQRDNKCTAPELTSFGASAVEVHRVPDNQEVNS